MLGHLSPVVVMHCMYTLLNMKFGSGNLIFLGRVPAGLSRRQKALNREYISLYYEHNPAAQGETAIDPPSASPSPRHASCSSSRSCRSCISSHSCSSSRRCSSGLSTTPSSPTRRRRAPRSTTSAAHEEPAFLPTSSSTSPPQPATSML